SKGAHAILKMYLQVSVDDSDPPGPKPTVLCADIFQESAITIQDPEVQPTRRHPNGVKNCPQSFTERDLFAFELVMRKHNSRMCSNTESESSDSS
ncbi:30561_t:CDS:2, partial [Gigaspora margarita]